MAVEKGGDERLAAQAIFYHTNAALNAGAITRAQAIEQLERLRFRWRGDGLELKTLRKLAALYFGRGQWREGLKTLRVATQNFAGQDAARVAQDDMRAAFVNLFLKGGADKMKPVDALALFYDNLDLTPIGPDGDEMIRRMSDRLVAVDLLGPAANLLAYQVDKRLDGIAKAQVATRLAAVYLMDHKPDKAVATIRDSQITGLPDEEMHAAHAAGSARLCRPQAMGQCAGPDRGGPGRRHQAAARRHLLGKRQLGHCRPEDRRIAGCALERCRAAERRRPRPGDAHRRGLFAWPMTKPAWRGCASHFAPKMKGTPDANLFAVLSADIDQHGLAFREAAAKIASVDTLQAFMKDFASASRREIRPPQQLEQASMLALAARPRAPACAASFSQPGSPISQWPMPSSTSAVARLPYKARRCAPRWRAD